jgi:hypothetical protein
MLSSLQNHYALERSVFTGYYSLCKLTDIFLGGSQSLHTPFLYQLLFLIARIAINGVNGTGTNLKAAPKKNRYL